ncbi:hypothetical protein DSO57_1007037 [Entomophthora muscae]|uniref:Uncharacterized protein n=1 Tax=Entomophthora muscae TaxID=34485 RepID=A0ACC2RM83_9FUNG|nr:hypothetical protein DSO57_1007037 [Entomophthora muscae]
MQMITLEGNNALLSFAQKESEKATHQPIVKTNFVLLAVQVVSAYVQTSTALMRVFMTRSDLCYVTSCFLCPWSKKTLTSLNRGGTACGQKSQCRFPHLDPGCQ